MHGKKEKEGRKDVKKSFTENIRRQLYPVFL